MRPNRALLSFDTQCGQKPKRIMKRLVNMPQKLSVTDHEPKMEKWLDNLEEVRRVTSRTHERKQLPAGKGRVHKGKTALSNARADFKRKAAKV